MKRISLILAAIAVCIGFSFSPLLVSAEESAVNPDISIDSVVDEEVVEGAESVKNESVFDSETEVDGVIPETEGSKWFDKTIKPFLVEYGASLLGVGTVAFIALKRLASIVKMFIDALTTLGIANKRVEDADKEITKLRTEFSEMKQELRAEFEAFKSELIESLKETVTDKMDDTNETVHKILEVEEIAYESNSKLVGNGTAKKIAEVIRK